MEPFRIICETCRSRLKIRSPEVIGEIHACPKCGSMVHIVPPAGWQPDSADLSSVLSGAATQSALSLSTTASVIIPASAAPAAMADPQPPADETAAGEIAAPAATVSSGSSWFTWAIVGAAVFAALAVGIVLWSGRGSETGRAVAAVAAETNVSKPDHPAQEPTAPSPTLADETSPAETLSADRSVLPAPTVVDHPSTGANELQTGKNPVTIESENEKASASREEPTAAAAAGASSQQPKSTEPETAHRAPKPVLKFDPLDFDPDRLTAAARSFVDSKPTTQSVPDQSLAEQPAKNSDAVRDPAAAAAPPAANPSISVRRGPPGAAPERATGLATSLKSFQVTAVPLSRLVETLSDVAGAGITLDPVAIQLVGASPRKTVSVSGNETTVEAVLRQALQNERLDLVVHGGQARVVLPKADAVRTIDYDVKDLAVGADAGTIARLIEQFVAPETWKPAGGSGTIEVNRTKLHIEQSEAVRRHAIIFCERLRLARGLAIQSKYPSALLSTESPNQALSARLGEPTTFTFLPWSRLADVVRQWQEMTGITILVDWFALSETELAPSSLVACSAIERTWSESLDGILAPLGLGWWAVDGETIQITSLAALERIQRVEFYQLPPDVRNQFPNGQALVASLRKEVAAPVAENAKSNPAQMYFDEPSGRLIVLASPSAHRQLNSRLTRAAQ